MGRSDLIPLTRPKPARPDLSRSTKEHAFWNAPAPDGMRLAYESGDEADGWEQWTAHLAGRTAPVSLEQLLAANVSPLLWSIPDGIDARHLATLTTAAEHLGLGQPRAKAKATAELNAALEHWPPNASPSRGQDERGSLEALGWCHALPRLAAFIPARTWWRLVDYLRGLAIKASVASGRVGKSSEKSGGKTRPLTEQLLGGELPLTLAYLFPEIAALAELQQQAHRTLSVGLIKLLDGEGLPHSKHFGLLRPLFACWTRCRAMGDCLAGGSWSDDAQIQYEWLVRHAIQLTRRDGSQTLSSGGTAGVWHADLFEAALRMGGDEDDRDIARLSLPKSRKVVDAPAINMALPKTAVHSEWSAASVLRPGWRPSDPQLTLIYPDGKVRMELQCARDVLWSGEWGLEVSSNGERLAAPAEWEEVCWISNESADYLELEARLSRTVRVQRQVLLARDDRFLFLADAVLSDRPAKLEYRGVLPLRPGVSFRGEAETREGFVVGRSPRALVLPLALPEWRIDPRVGVLEQSAQGLELRQTAEGRALFAPLFIGLEPKLFPMECTWRSLTVGENLQIQPPDVAVGYRVQIANEQWLIYRALSAKGNRTLLGHNLSSEMLVARFEDEGQVEALIEIE